MVLLSIIGLLSAVVYTFTMIQSMGILSWIWLQRIKMVVVVTKGMPVAPQRSYV
jgi:hypothetical protein